MSWVPSFWKISAGRSTYQGVGWYLNELPDELCHFSGEFRVGDFLGGRTPIVDPQLKFLVSVSLRQYQSAVDSPDCLVAGTRATTPAIGSIVAESRGFTHFKP